MLPDSQNNLGQAQHQRYQGLGQGQGLPQGLIFSPSFIDKSCSGWSIKSFECAPRQPGQSGSSPALLTQGFRPRSRTSPGIDLANHLEAHISPHRCYFQKWKALALLGPQLSRLHPAPHKKDEHRNVGDQFHLFLVLLGVLCWSRPVGPLGPSNFFYPIFTGGTTWKLMKSPYKVKIVGGSQGCH